MTYPDTSQDTDTTQGPDTQQTGDQFVEPQDTSGNQTPWAHLLEDLPESVRPLVEPKFREWDAGVTQRFQQVHSQYEPYKAYEPLLESGYNVDEVQQAIALAEALNQDPEAVYRALVESYGFGQGEQGQGNDTQGQEDSDEDDYDPRFLRVEQMADTMAEIMTQQQQAQLQAEQDAALDQALNAAKEEYGDFEESIVLGWMHADPSLKLGEAVQHYQDLIDQQIAARQAPQAPTIMGGGGSVPSQSIDPASLNEQERKALVTQWLANSNRE